MFIAFIKPSKAFKMIFESTIMSKDNTNTIVGKLLEANLDREHTNMYTTFSVYPFFGLRLGVFKMECQHKDTY